MRLNSLILMVLLPVTVLRCEEKKILLKDGSTRTVHVSILGNPIHHKGKLARVLDIHPAVETMFGSMSPLICWQFLVTFQSGFYGTIVISSPNVSREARATIDPQSLNTNFFRDAGIEAFDRKSEPGAWEWLKSDKEAWIPFHFRIFDTDGKLMEEFDDWGYVSASDLQKAKKDMAALHLPDLYSEQRAVDLPGGERIQVSLLDGNPVHCSTREFGITDLAPTVLPSKDHKAMVPVWVLKGWINSDEKRRLTITCPWFSKTFTQTVDAGPTGRFMVIFASKGDAPDLWRWLEDGGDTLFPWKVHVEAPNHLEGQDIIEWARITPKVKDAIWNRMNQK